MITDTERELIHQECPTCKGHGVVAIPWALREVWECGDCEGSGKVQGDVRYLWRITHPGRRTRETLADLIGAVVMVLICYVLIVLCLCM